MMVSSSFRVRTTLCAGERYWCNQCAFVAFERKRIDGESARFVEPLQRPAGRVPDALVGVLERAAQSGLGRALAPVSEDERGVAGETRTLGPEQRGAAEARAKGLVVQREQRLQRLEWPARRQRRLPRQRRLAIPWTDVLADVTPEEPVGHVRLELVGDRAAMLDRQIGQAAARVEHPRRRE